MSDRISEDTLTQILKNLPIKSLLRFLCVSKWWKGLIDSQEFVQLHLAVQKPRALVSYSDERNVEKLAVVELGTVPLVHTLRIPIEVDQRLSILGTLHGVVCLYAWHGNIFLWNPSIRKISSIPFPLDSGWDFEEQWLCHAFWIEPSTKDFKVIILLFGWMEGRVDVRGFLYSSLDPDWSLIPPEKLEGGWVHGGVEPPVMVGGVAHWLGCYHGSVDHGRLGVMMCFDFRQESFEFIEMPDLEYRFMMTLAKWHGALSVLCCHKTFPHRCDLYMRQDGSWVAMLSFNLFSPTTAATFFTARMLCEFQERFWILFSALPDDIIHRRILDHLGLYDSRVGCTMALISGVMDRCVADHFVESLLFP